MRSGIHFNGRNLRLTFLLLFAGTVLTALSQNQVSRSSFDSAFHSFRKSITGEFERFQTRNDSIFLEFLKQSWKSFEIMEDSANPKVKPKVQPRILPEGIKSENIPDTLEKVKDSVQFRIFEEPVPEKNSFGNISNTTSFDFYGEKNNLPAIPDIPVQAPVDNLYVKKFYGDFCEENTLQELSEKLNLTAKDLRLNDFGRCMLVQKAGRSLFREVNKQVLFSWACLVGSGMDVKLGYKGNDIYLLISCDFRLYTSFITIGDTRYYLLKFPGQKLPQQRSLLTYTSNYPGKIHPVSLQIKEIPHLPDYPETHVYLFRHDSVQVSINLSLIGFFSDYPTCELKMYFNAPFSAKAMNSLDRRLLARLQGRSETGKVNLLLSFIQESFPYKTDQEQFGHEKYMFSDEAVYYHYTDCDDRAVLFAHLVKHYTGLDVVGLNYPDHVATAVKFTNPINGDYVPYNGNKYFICDPTCLGARAGMTMDSIKNLKPEVISINN